MKNYDNIVYAQTRLLGTVVRVNGHPARIDALDDKVVIYTDLLSGFKTNAPLKAMDITPLPLGYVNYDRHASYVSRVPKRNDWKQGLRPQNMNGGYYHIEDIPWVEIAKTIEGMFPSLKTVMKTVDKGDASSMAFHRNWALCDNKTIFYKGNYIVGTWTDRCQLDDKFDWLSESLEEAIG